LQIWWLSLSFHSMRDLLITIFWGRILGYNTLCGSKICWRNSCFICADTEAWSVTGKHTELYCFPQNLDNYKRMRLSCFIIRLCANWYSIAGVLPSLHDGACQQYSNGMCNTGTIP
jgi:hypothetical protein